jgi:hypothetical protein
MRRRRWGGWRARLRMAALAVARRPHGHSGYSGSEAWPTAASQPPSLCSDRAAATARRR